MVGMYTEVHDVTLLQHTTYTVLQDSNEYNDVNVIPVCAATAHVESSSFATGDLV